MSKFADALAALVDAHIEDMLVAGANGSASESVEGDVQKARATKTKAKSKAAAEEVEADEDDEEEDQWAVRLDELMKKSLTALTKIAKALEFDDEDLEGTDKDTLAASIVAAEKEDAEGSEDDEEEESDEEAEDEEDAEEEDDDSEEEEDEDAEEDDEEEGYTREELEAMGIRELKALAKESGWSAEDLKPYTAKNIEELVDALAGGDEESEDEEEDEEEEDGYSEEDLDEMSLAELKKVAKDEYGIRLKVGMKKPAVIAAILKKAAA